MRRTHRAVHRRLWPALAAAVGAALVLALVLRPPPENAVPAPAEASFTVIEVLR